MEARRSTNRRAHGGASPGRGRRPRAEATAYQLAAIVESSQDAIIGGTIKGLVTTWNAAAERMLGYRADEIVGRPVSTIWPAGSLDHFEKIQARLLRGESIPAADSQRVRKDDSLIDVSVTTSPVKDSSGRVVGIASILRDITERRQAEAATRLLASVVESSDDAILAGTLDGTITSWNAGAERLYGYSAEEMIGQSIARVRPEGNLDDVADIQTALAAGLQVAGFETQEVRKDGTLIDVSVSIAPLKDHEGRVIGIASIIRDITERRAAEATARLLAGVVESSGDAIVSRDLAGTVRSWNPAAERVLGYTAEEVVGRSTTAPVWRADRERFEEMQRRLAAGERIPPFEAKAVRGDDTIIDVSVTASPMKDAGGRVTGVAVIFRDITESKQALRELHEARRRFEGAFDNAPIGMALVAPAGAWLEVNGALCRLLGRPEQELLTTDSQSLTHPEDLESDLERVQQALAGEIDGFETQKRYLRPDGRVVWAALSVSLVRGDDGEALYFVSQIRDITERKESEDELLRYTEHLNELALQDPLTGLRNYRDFHSMIDTELQRSRRYDTEWSVVLLDVDHFHEINAGGGGHVEGDRVLREVGAAIAEAGRASDLAARIGSDEFALVLAGTIREDAERTAQRIASEVAARLDGVSVSYGTASWPSDGESKELVLVRADMHLQAAKPRRPMAREGVRGGTASQTDGVLRILELARKQLGMDLAYVAELTETEQVFRAVAGDPASFGAAEGATMPLEYSYCRQMVEGAIPNVIPDTATQPDVASLAITAAAGIGAYLGVPLELANGRLYGSLCALSHDPRPELADRHVELMRFLAGLIVDQIERDERGAVERRSHAELAGIHALMSALVARDHYTGEHSKTVVELATRVARRLGLTEERVLEVEQVALLHDIGKVGVPDSVLQKRGPLNAQESEVMRQHPAIGARILAGTETLAHLAPAVKAEHERYDGRGYPDGLAGEDIPLASRIGFACDAYHAMTSDRPYRAALAAEQARAELVEGAGSQFDPAVVDALLTELEGKPAAQPEHGRPASLLAANVLDGSTPRQVPVWEPRARNGSAAALGDVRAVCRRCGTHVFAIVSEAALSGCCGNCGGYELDLVEGRSPERLEGVLGRVDAPQAASE